MLPTFQKLAGDEAGFIISAELVLITTIVVLGMVVGLTAVRDAVTNELNDVAHAFGAVSQTYHVAGLTKNCNNCNDIAHSFGTVWHPHHVAGRTKSCNNWCAHASINGFGFNDADDECDSNRISDTDVCRENDPIHGEND
jgi:hypothetical protein